MGHPFTAERILEYIGLFIGATVPFALLLPKMAPHDRISLDFDWIFTENGLRQRFTGLSDLVTGVFSSTQIVCDRFFLCRMGTSEKILQKAEEKPVKEQRMKKEQKPAAMRSRRRAGLKEICR